MANFTVPMKIIRDRESFLEELNQGKFGTVCHLRPHHRRIS